MSTKVLSSAKYSRRRKIFFRALFVFLGLMAAFSLFLFALFFVDALKVRYFKIEGAVILPEKQIASEAEALLKVRLWGIFPRDRMFLVPYDKIKALLSSRFLKISDTKFQKKFSATPVIQIEERRPSGILCKEQEIFCFYLDRTGFVFEEAPLFSSGVFYKFFDERSKQSGLGEFLFEQSAAEKIFDFMNLLYPKIQITEIRLKENGIREFYSDEGWYMITRVDDDYSAVYGNLMAVFSEIKNQEKTLEYIDLRFGNKVFYKFK